jgi:hypothetical protein
VALGWNIYRDVIDRGKLRVSCYIGQIGQMGVGVVADNLLVWNVTNVGRQPVMVSQIGGKRRKKPQHWLVLSPKGESLPKMLKPGEYFMGYTEDLGGIQPDVTDLWAIDTVGRRYRAPAKQVRKVLVDIEEKRNKGELKSRK